MADPIPSLLFAGAAGTVTGSRHLVRARGMNLLLDCGLFQGEKALRLRNWEPPRFDPRAVDAVLLSHAHLDHSGYLPVLVRRGFAGPVYCTSATADLTAIVLRDAAHLAEEDAERANRRRYTRHLPALPLFTSDDAERAITMLTPRPRGSAFPLLGGAAATFREAGHILGSATTTLDLDGPASLRLVYSGDLGRWGRPILRDPELITEADVLLLESTYGDRLHASDPADQLARIIEETAHRGGVVIVPAFAIDRAQELLWILRELADAGRIPLVSIHLDSPMAIAVSDVYARHPEEHDDAMVARLAESGSPFAPPLVELARTREESRALLERQAPMIVIAGSGMATGGRVLHHLAHRLPDHRNTVLLTGFQAAGTRGSALLEGARTLRIHGRDVPVRAQVAAIDGLSAHADRSELLRWLRGFTRAPASTYLVHGEPAQARSLAAAIERELGWPVHVAAHGEVVTLAARPTGRPPSLAGRGRRSHATTQRLTRRSSCPPPRDPRRST
jgi:metallo-beta-lactamase family protein